MDEPQNQHQPETPGEPSAWRLPSDRIALTEERARQDARRNITLLAECGLPFSLKLLDAINRQSAEAFLRELVARDHPAWSEAQRESIVERVLQAVFTTAEGGTT